MSSVWAVVPAAGSGRRMAAEIPKQYLKLNGVPILEHTLRAFLPAQISAVWLLCSIPVIDARMPYPAFLTLVYRLRRRR